VEIGDKRETGTSNAPPVPSFGLLLKYNSFLGTLPELNLLTELF